MSLRAILLVALTGALLAAGLVADAVAPPRDEAAAAPPVVAEPVAGAALCPVHEGVEVLAWSPGESDLTLTRLGRDGVLGRRVVGLDGLQELDVAASVGLDVRWRDAPAVVGRTGGDAEGTLEGACVGGVARRWVVPGLDTAGGATATLHLANPFAEVASVRVVLTTRDGPVAPIRLENLVVPGRSGLTVDLTEFAPEQPDLGVVVATSSGRVVAEAVQRYAPEIGGLQGAALVAATSELDTTWTLPAVVEGETTTSWLWVTNPTEQAADIVLTASTSQGATTDAASRVVAPGTTDRIDLRGLLGDATFGSVTVRTENDVPIAVSGGVVRTDEDPERSGFASVTATRPSDGVLVALGASDDDRNVRLVAANPGAELARAEVSGPGWDRDVTLELDPGELTQLEAPTSGTAHAMVVDVTEGALVAARVVTSGDGSLDLTVDTAVPVPGTETFASVEVPRLVQAPDLVEGLGTAGSPVMPVGDVVRLDDDRSIPVPGELVPLVEP